MTFAKVGKSGAKSLELPRNVDKGRGTGRTVERSYHPWDYACTPLRQNGEAKLPSVGLCLNASKAERWSEATIRGILPEKWTHVRA